MNPSLLPILIAVLAAGAVLLLSFGVAGYLGGAGRLGRLRGRLGLVEESGGRKGLHTMGRGVSAAVRELGLRLGPQEASERSKGRLDMVQAGYRNPNAAAVYQGVKAGLTFLLPGVFLGLRFLDVFKTELVGTAFVSVLLASIGCFAPAWWLRSRTNARKITITNELPDALDLLVVCVESGMGLDQAIHRVSEEMRLSGPVVSRELGQVTLELRAGKQRQEALRSLAARIGLEDVNSLTTLLIQADVFGISVARTLRVYSETLRTKRYQRAEEKAAQLPVKLLIPLIFCILPALFVAIMGPAGIKLMDVFAQMNH